MDNLTIIVPLARATNEQLLEELVNIKTVVIRINNDNTLLEIVRNKAIIDLNSKLCSIHQIMEDREKAISQKTIPISVAYSNITTAQLIMLEKEIKQSISQVNNNPHLLEEPKVKWLELNNALLKSYDEELVSRGERTIINIPT